VRKRASTPAIKLSKWKCNDNKTQRFKRNATWTSTHMPAHIKPFTNYIRKKQEARKQKHNKTKNHKRTPITRLRLLRLGFFFLFVYGVNCGTHYINIVCKSSVACARLGGEGIQEGEGTKQKVSFAMGQRCMCKYYRGFLVLNCLHHLQDFQIIARGNTHGPFHLPRLPPLALVVHNVQ